MSNMLRRWKRARAVIGRGAKANHKAKPSSRHFRKPHVFYCEILKKPKII